MISDDQQGRLAGRVYVVTGVSRRAGIGAGIARRLVDEGAALLVQSWTAYDATQPWGADDGAVFVDELRAAGGRVEALEADLSDPAAPAAVIGAAVSAFGHVDGVVANHADGTGGGLDALTAVTLDHSFAVNTRSAILLAKELADQHDGRPGGRIVLFTSGQHLGAMPDELPYVVSKGALQQATASLAAVLAPRGITVNCVNPGPTDTAWADEAGRTWVLERMPLGRWGLPDDAARLVAFLLSDDGAWICGQTLNSEGGFRR